MVTSIVLPTSSAPRVSIVIVAARQPRLLERCLASLARQDAGVPFETIVVLNDALPEVATVAVDRLAGATVITSPVALGLAGGLNRGRAAACAEYLVSLHDDAEGEPGWLEALVATADAHPEAGAVGSRMLHADGTPQSLGSVLWSDGDVWTLGRGEDSLVPDSVAPTAVDYCGSAALLVRAATWDAVGGADERFYPAYYVDVDLCLGVWTAGQAVLGDPVSRVRHRRGASTEAQFREFLLRRNRALLRDKWREQLAAFEPPAPGSRAGLERAVARAQERGRRARALAVETGVPRPRPPLDALAQERRALETALALERAWSRELRKDRQRAEARERMRAAACHQEAAAERTRAATLQAALAAACEQRDRLASEAAVLHRAARCAAVETAALRERAAVLAAIEDSRWWRLYQRLLPLLRFFRRLTRRADASRRG